MSKNTIYFSNYSNHPKFFVTNLKSLVNNALTNSKYIYKNLQLLLSEMLLLLTTSLLKVLSCRIESSDSHKTLSQPKAFAHHRENRRCTKCVESCKNSPC